MIWIAWLIDYPSIFPLCSFDWLVDCEPWLGLSEVIRVIDWLIDWLTVSRFLQSLQISILSDFLPEQLAVYTWKDATLKELSSLVRSAHPDARLRDTFFEFSLVFPDFKSSHYRSRHIGTTRNGMKGQDDNKTLADVGFQIGNYLTVQIIPPNHEDAKRFWRIGPHFPHETSDQTSRGKGFSSRSSSELGQQSALLRHTLKSIVCLSFSGERPFLFRCLCRMTRFL